MYHDYNLPSSLIVKHQIDVLSDLAAVAAGIKTTTEGLGGWTQAVGTAGGVGPVSGMKRGFNLMSVKTKRLLVGFQKNATWCYDSVVPNPPRNRATTVDDDHGANGTSYREVMMHRWMPWAVERDISTPCERIQSHYE